MGISEILGFFIFLLINFALGCVFLLIIFALDCVFCCISDLFSSRVSNDNGNFHIYNIKKERYDNINFNILAESDKVEISIVDIVSVNFLNERIGNIPIEVKMYKLEENDKKTLLLESVGNTNNSGNVNIEMTLNKKGYYFVDIKIKDVGGAKIITESNNFIFEA